MLAAQQFSGAASDPSHEELYRGFVISFYAPPIPDRSSDWQWVHFDYDGPEDNRCGHAASLSAARAEVDFWHEDNDCPTCGLPHCTAKGVGPCATRKPTSAEAAELSRRNEEARTQ